MREILENTPIVTDLEAFVPRESNFDFINFLKLFAVLTIRELHSLMNEVQKEEIKEGKWTTDVDNRIKFFHSD